MLASQLANKPTDQPARQLKIQSERKQKTQSLSKTIAPIKSAKQLAMTKPTCSQLA